MRFRALDGLVFVNAISLANDCIAKYNTGYGPPTEDGTPDVNDPSFIPPQTLAPINGEPLIVSAQAWRVCAGLYSAQVCEEAEDQYALIDFVHLMARSYAIADQLGRAFMQLQALASAGGENDPNPPQEP